MLISIFSNILVALSSFLLARMIYYKQGQLDLLLSGFSLFLAQIIAVEYLLGIIEWLYLGQILCLHIVILLVVYLIYRNKKYQPFSGFEAGFIFEHKVLLFGVVIFLGFFAVKLWVNLINPPLCPDSLQYHLSFPASWIKNGNLNNPIVIFGSVPTSAELTALTYYPINAELFFFWLMLPLKNAFLADIGQAPFYFIGILCIYAILRKYSLKKETALLIGVLWALIPNLFKQIRYGSQIDVICAVLFLLSLNSLLNLKREWSRRNAFIFGTILGIFVGTKALNLFWSVALAPFFIFVAYAHYLRGWLKEFLRITGIIFLSVFLFGGYSYLKTFFLTGNPFYPLKIVLWGKSIFPGIIDKISFSQLFVKWNEFKIWDFIFGEGLGVQLLALIIPGTVIPLIAIWFMKKKEASYRIEQFCLYLIPALMFFMYMFCIRAYWTRYIFPYLAMGLITCAIFLNRYRWADRYIVVVGLISILGSAAELEHSKKLITPLVISGLLFVLALMFKERIIKYLQAPLSYKKIFVVILACAAALFILNDKYDKEEFSRYHKLFQGKEADQRDIALAWEWMNNNTSQAQMIAYTGRSEFYPLFGAKLKNNAIYVSVNRKPAIAHLFSDGLYRREKNFSQWIENIKKEKIGYLFVALPLPLNNDSMDPGEFPIEDKWAREHPDNFMMIFQNSLAHIYKVSFDKP